jgi:hypothetical protein
MIKADVDWETTHKPRKKDETAQVLRRVDASGRPLPRPLEALNVERWMWIRGYFVDVCHHAEVANPAEFAACVEDLELFLLERLVPRTFSDFDKIDELIREGGDA